MQNGLLLKGIGGFYTVLTDTGEELTCKARGRFRKEGITPLCGDRVEIEEQQDGMPAVTKILPRKNALTRPPAANIDQLIIVLSLSAPKADLGLCDKLMLQAAMLHIEPVIVLNKCDEADNAAISEIAAQYAAYRTLVVSAKLGQGAEALSDLLAGKVSCFAGQSAVGKSSLLNRLMPALQLETGGLARKTEHGKHTTRHAELWPYKTGAVLDTPGFSLFDLPVLEQSQLDACYREFGDAPKDCRFPDCMHISEPDCAVKKLLDAGALHPERYARYVTLAEQFHEMRKHRYD